MTRTGDNNPFSIMKTSQVYPKSIKQFFAKLRRIRLDSMTGDIKDSLICLVYYNVCLNVPSPLPDHTNTTLSDVGMCEGK